ncbi:hypothetical protein C8F04DRAFT_1274446 [Mycena alexandri]|uniref:Uncharacterized protein n=1 Tax=Mycena alexandri TaxID=1745969 RepID=A0AAD6S4S4_9AGAR|nr:hypothetical protein C8F04DRAFT_1274446 [Mycena alexandri]
MGSAISSIVDKQQADMKAQAQDQLNALLTMADLKYQNFIATVQNIDDHTLIPIDKIIIKDHTVSAGVTSDSSNLKNAISGAVKDFAKGDVLDGLTAVIGFGLDAVFGNVAANQSEHTTYAITCGELGAIMRTDVSIFCYTFTSEAMTKVTNNVVAVAYTVSTVHSSELDQDTLRDIVQVCYGGLVTKEKLQAIYKQILDAYNDDRGTVAP